MDINSQRRDRRRPWARRTCRRAAIRSRRRRPRTRPPRSRRSPSRPRMRPTCPTPCRPRNDAGRTPRCLARTSSCLIATMRYLWTRTMKVAVKNFLKCLFLVIKFMGRVSLYTNPPVVSIFVGKMFETVSTPLKTLYLYIYINGWARTNLALRILLSITFTYLSESD